MVNHVHIFIPKPASRGSLKPSRIIQHARPMPSLRIMGRTGSPFWQDESYDHWVRGPEELAKIVRYIEENPVAAGLVSRGEDWRWSSAFGMAGGPARGSHATPASRYGRTTGKWNRYFNSSGNSQLFAVVALAVKTSTRLPEPL